MKKKRSKKCRFNSKTYMGKASKLSPLFQGFWLQSLCLMWNAKNRGKITYSLHEYTKLFGYDLRYIMSAAREFIRYDIAKVKLEVDLSLTDCLDAETFPLFLLEDIEKLGAEHPICANRLIDHTVHEAAKGILMTLTCQEMQKPCLQKRTKSEKTSY